MKILSSILLVTTLSGLIANDEVGIDLSALRNSILPIGNADAALVPLDERSRGAWSGIYHDAAPSVVLIRLGNGYGSGFIIEGGDILTNYHVVDGAETNADGHYIVQIELGDLAADGLMEVSTDTLEGIVYASDEASDLALIRIQDASIRSGLGARALELSPSPVLPGEGVALIGNGALGFRWAIKVGAISAVNRQDRIRLYEDQIRQHMASEMPNFEHEPKPRQEAMMDEVRAEMLGESADVLLIESTASCVGGDSGGPLLNESGEVVGICHASIMDGEQVTERYYYIHKKEMLDFLANLPAEPLQAARYGSGAEKSGQPQGGKEPGSGGDTGKPSSGGGFGEDGLYYPDGASGKQPGQGIKK